MKRFAALILSMAMAMAEEHDTVDPVEQEQADEEDEVSDDITVLRMQQMYRPMRCICTIKRQLIT